jgi:predicted lipoprotein
MKMKNYLQLLIVPALVAGMSLTSCSDDNNEDEETSAKETVLSKAATDYINNTVLPTYKGMADAAIELFDYCEVMQEKHSAGTLTGADVQNAATAWKTSRKYWELSEAFLFGPASDYNIDPHIDSWPLDKDAMDRLLVEIRNGAEYSLDNNFGYGLLGFHSIEYMLYELSSDGNTSSIHSTSYTTEELKYLVMVAEDLRNQCVCLEACWAGTENLSAEKQDILEEAELDKGKNYGWMMQNAGKAGSIYKTYQETAEEIIQGCIDIADEVGNTKIGRPHQGSTLEDRNYIESPYSLNSIEDFVDNIKSIRNAYCGANSTDASVSTYIKSVNSDLDSRVRTAIDNAITSISAIPEPFAKNATGTAAGNAVKVVGTDLVDVLEEAYQQVLK